MATKSLTLAATTPSSNEPVPNSSDDNRGASDTGEEEGCVTEYEDGHFSQRNQEAKESESLPSSSPATKELPIYEEDSSETVQDEADYEEDTETPRREAIPDPLLREESMYQPQECSFNLMEYSPGILENLSLTPKSRQYQYATHKDCNSDYDVNGHSLTGSPCLESSVAIGSFNNAAVQLENRTSNEDLKASADAVGVSRPRSLVVPDEWGNISMHPIFKEPLVLIHSDSSGQLHLNQQTLQLLDTLDTPIVVIGIAGSYRSGKSYMMNYLAGRSTGFQVGNTVETCTRGIWIWCLPHPLLPDTTLMWMDTEGLDDPDKGDYNFDMQVIVLTILLSSTFIYNTQGRIDNTLIKQLGFVSDLTNHLQVRTGHEKETGDDFDMYFPNLFVVVRDFFLELRNKSTLITSDEYFEQCLRVKEIGGKSEARHVREYNEPRIKIRKFFPSNKRYCRTLPNPNKSNYRNGLLDYFLGTTKEDLNPNFWAQAEELKELLLNVSPQKTFGQCDKVTGRMFGSMAQCYVAAIEQGEIPCIQSAFQLTAMQENRRILEQALAEYRSSMLELCLPLSQEQLFRHHQHLMRDLLEKYRKKIIFEEAHDFRQEYDVGVAAAYNEIVVLNEARSQELCESILDKLNETIANKFRNGEYLCSGGYAIYTEDLALLKTKYITTANKGVKSDTVLHKFIQWKEAEISTIVAIDKEMSIIRVQEEAEKRQKSEVQLREKMLKDEAARSHAREEHLRKSLMENQETLQKEMERRLTEQQTKYEHLMKLREENHERLVTELKSEIARLKFHPVNRAVKVASQRCSVM